MHVDGFRFDLAATLAREFHEVDKLSAFFDLIQQDPVISQVKLIAEPWDVGEGGYQVGNFPPLWTEWNGKYRDTVRDFWRGEPSAPSASSPPLTGSSDLYEHSGRKPIASINFVTAHDGFTLRDLVSYNDKHNEANGEHNRDGESHNRSAGTAAPRAQRRPGHARAALAPAAQLPHHPPARQGVPMMLARRRDRPHPAGQQQRLLPGQRALLGRLGRLTDDSFYLFFNAGSAPVSYVIPQELGEPDWQLVLDTEVGFVPKGQRCTSGVGMDIAPHTLRLHRRRQVGLPSEE
jgi:hypothetical protein